jgi:hypothetical protein
MVYSSIIHTTVSWFRRKNLTILLWNGVNAFLWNTTLHTRHSWAQLNTRLKSYHLYYLTRNFKIKNWIKLLITSCTYTTHNTVFLKTTHHITKQTYLEYVGLLYVHTGYWSYSDMAANIITWLKQKHSIRSTKMRYFLRYTKNIFMYI